jgi:plastocyanin
MATKEVTVKDFSYDPDPVTIEVGDEVIWTHDANNPHTVTFGDVNYELFEPGNSTPPHVFAEPGEVPYRCTFHDLSHGMTGTVIVKAKKRS